MRYISLGVKIMMSLKKIAFNYSKQIIIAFKEECQHKKLSKYVVRELKQKNTLFNEKYFNEPNIDNVSLLRDYVHHKLTKKHLALPKAKKYGGGRISMLKVLKWLEAEKYRVQCAGLAQILYGIYKGLGYNAVLCDWVDKTPFYYTDSHMLVEVYIPEIKKYIIQDPSFNIIVTFHNEPLSTLELIHLLRNKEIVEKKEIIFVNDQKGEEGVFTTVKDLNYEKYIEKYFGQIYSWRSDSNIMYPAVKLHKRTHV